MPDRSTGTRRVAGDVCLNFRDLGGLRVRGVGQTQRGALMRSGALLRDTGGTLGETVRRLNLCAYVDLRSPSEATREGWEPDLAAYGVTRISAPLSISGFGKLLGETPQPSDYARAYVQLVQQASEQIADILEIIAKAPWPLVFGCSLGKDRTAVISALILTARGVGQADVCKDHALSHRQLGRVVERLQGDRERKGLTSQAYSRRLTATSASMRAFLEWWMDHDAPNQRVAAARFTPLLHAINERWPVEIILRTS